MATKIETFKAAQWDHSIMAEGAYKSLNEGKYKDSRRDKYDLSLGSRWHEHGENMGVLVGYSGFYGSSGCSYHATPRLAEYLQIVINKNMKQLVDEAIELSEKDVEALRLIAEKEAKEVLQQL